MLNEIIGNMPTSRFLVWLSQLVLGTFNLWASTQENGSMLNAFFAGACLVAFVYIFFLESYRQLLTLTYNELEKRHGNNRPSPRDPR